MNERRFTEKGDTPMKLHGIIRDILDTHHAYVRRAMPDISAQLVDWRARDQSVEPLAREFAALCEELALHMMKEEQILFPSISRFEATGAAGGCGLDGPIAQMEFEHTRANRSLEQIRTFSEKISSERGAALGDSERAALNALDEFRADLVEHIRKEEEDLFPAVSKTCGARVA
jgi:regulator of cell morphogenesis and NO signaling